MKLTIEKSDFQRVGLPEGEYDLDDLNAVKDVEVVGSPAGSYHEIKIDLRMYGNMNPEPGSIGEPHFKFGAEIEYDPVQRRKMLTVFGRAKGVVSESFGYRHYFDECDLKNSSVDHGAVEHAVQAVSKEIVRALVQRAIKKVLKSEEFVAVAQPSQDTFFGLKSKKKAGCAECGGSGVWKNPASGVESPCSYGCRS